MDPYNGRIYPTVDEARAAGVTDPVEVIGSPKAIQALSDAARAARKKLRKKLRKAEKASRRANR